MYELTIRGITKQFDSAADMAEWQETMLAPRKKLKPRRGKQRANKIRDESNPLGKFMRGRGRQAMHPALNRNDVGALPTDPTQQNDASVAQLAEPGY
jgi:hypothetical protein